MLSHRGKYLEILILTKLVPKSPKVCWPNFLVHNVIFQSLHIILRQYYPQNELFFPYLRVIPKFIFVIKYKKNRN